MYQSYNSLGIIVIGPSSYTPGTVKIGYRQTVTD